MVVKIYVSGISGNKEVKKRQQRVLMILDSKCVKYEVIDIAEPGKDADKEFMQINSKSNGATVSDSSPRHPLPPQIFNNDEYCGDYDQFDLANEIDTLEQFLKVEVPKSEDTNNVQPNGDAATEEKNGLVTVEKPEEEKVENDTENKEEIDTNEKLKETDSTDNSKETDADDKVNEDKTEERSDDVAKEVDNVEGENEAVENGNVEEKTDRVSASRESSKEKDAIENDIGEETSSKEIPEEEATNKEVLEETQLIESEVKKELTPSEALIDSEKQANE